MKSIRTILLAFTVMSFPVLVMAQDEGFSVNTETVSRISGVARAIDGDTILLWEETGGRPIWIRLAYIDAPEMGQPCGNPSGGNWDCGSWVTEQVSSALEGQLLSCEIVDRFRQGYPGTEDSPLIGACFFAQTQKNGRVRPYGDSLNRWMLSAGLAIAPPSSPREERLVENQARDARQGIWNSCLINPRTWRRFFRGEVEIEDWDACPGD